MQEEGLDQLPEQPPMSESMSHLKPRTELLVGDEGWPQAAKGMRNHSKDVQFIKKLSATKAHATQGMNA
jgi:hypothetical protein